MPLSVYEHQIGIWVRVTSNTQMFWCEENKWAEYIENKWIEKQVKYGSSNKKNFPEENLKRSKKRAAEHTAHI